MLNSHLDTRHPTSRCKPDMKNSELSHDLAIRVPLDNWIRARPENRHDAVIRHEMGVGEGARRVDIAVLNGHLSGYEIKAESDTLTRLPGQAARYDQVFDYMTLVSTEKYLWKAAELLPEHWGLSLAYQAPTGVRFKAVRSPHINRATDKASIAQLLWRDEMLSILRENGAAKGTSSMSRWSLIERLIEVLSKAALRRKVLATVKSREIWSGGQLRQTSDGL